MNLTPASSIDLPSEAILTRVSESGTRLMQTAIFTKTSRCTTLRRQVVRNAQERNPGALGLATSLQRTVLASYNAVRTPRSRSRADVAAVPASRIAAPGLR